jgi:hypothetical protein
MGGSVWLVWRATDANTLTQGPYTGRCSHGSLKLPVLQPYAEPKMSLAHLVVLIRCQALPKCLAPFNL